MRSGGAHYVLALKGNRSTLHKHFQKLFAEAERDDYRGVSHFASGDEGHGRTELRIVRAMSLGELPEAIKAPWTDIKTIVQIDRVRSADALTVHRGYYVSSHRADAKELASRIRKHWSIENQLHYCLDVAFGEDRRTIRSENGAQNFALVTRYALSMLKREPTKRSLAMKLRQAAWSESYFLDVIACGFAKI